MPHRTAQSDPHRLLPKVARAFAELGYRKATTAELARRCRVRENILYRAWPDKKAMFLAAIDHVYKASVQTWRTLLEQHATRAPAERLLEYESAHHGEFGLYRIVFVALTEADDAEVRDSLRQMYRQFHAFLREYLPDRAGAGRDDLAWMVIGLGTVSNIMRELDLLPEARRRQWFGHIGRLMLQPP